MLARAYHVSPHIVRQEWTGKDILQALASVEMEHERHELYNQPPKGSTHTGASARQTPRNSVDMNSLPKVHRF